MEGVKSIFLGGDYGRDQRVGKEGFIGQVTEGKAEGGQGETSV